MTRQQDGNEAREDKALLLRLLDDDDVRRKLAEVIEYLIAIGAIRTRSTTFSSCRSPDGAAIPTAAPATGPNTTALDMSIYTTDEYPREGCTLRITVDSRHGGRYIMHVRAPNDGFIECYLADSPRALGRMVREWCEGRKPKMYDRSDQEALGS